MNVDLNAGGLLGALVGGALGFGVAYVLADGDAAQMGPKIKIGIGALIAGAIGGNLLWAAVFGTRKTGRPDDPDRDYDDRPRRRDRDEYDDRPRRDRGDDRPRSRGRDRDDDGYDDRPRRR
jgi:hypothetical protein